MGKNFEQDVVVSQPIDNHFDLLNNKTKKNSLSIFMALVFLGVIFNGSMMLLGKYFVRDMGIFAQLQMLLPAAAAMIAIKYGSGFTNENGISDRFYKTYLTGTVIALSLALGYVLTGNKSLVSIIGIIFIFFSIMLLVFSRKNKVAEPSQASEMVINRNLKLSFLLIMGFVGLYFSYEFIAEWLGVTLGVASSSEFYKLKSNAVQLSMILLPTFFISSMPFLGEEIGWRYFLQPVLQQRFGLRNGVLLVGVIWGLWHAPLNFMLYSPETPMLSLVNQIVLCICYSIYLGYVYLKTQNIWTVSFIHFVNNSFVILYDIDQVYNLVLNPSVVALNALVLLVLYLPFMFSNVFKDKNIT